jgi:T4-like virus tail tube protein gp19
MGLTRNYALELDGTLAGKVAVDSLGDAVADVVIVTDKPSGVDKKHISSVRFSPITIKAGVAMNRNFYDWIKRSWNREAPRKNGTIIVFDQSTIEIGASEFSNALITETTFSALDTTSKDSAEIAVKIQPEYTRHKSVGKATAVNLGVYAAASPRRWLKSSFRLNIDGLSAACSRVTQIASLAVKVAAVDTSVGDNRRDQIESGKKDVSDLVITLPDTNADDFYAWFKEFAIRGNNTSNFEKSGTLEYLTPDGKKAYFTLTFRSMGIVAVSSAVGSGAGSVTARMYCDDILFDYDAFATL